MNTQNRSIINIYIILSILIFSVDRLTKYLAVTFLGSYKIIKNFLKFKLILNRGISLGIFNSENQIIFSLVTVMVILITCYIIQYSILRFKENYSIFGEILILTGSISNISDRLIYGGVVDFVAVNISSLIPATFFNLADISISVGIIIMLIQFYRSEINNN